jgi:hypothetical protein
MGVCSLPNGVDNFVENNTNKNNGVLIIYKHGVNLQTRKTRTKIIHIVSEEFERKSTKHL